MEDIQMTIEAVDEQAHLAAEATITSFGYSKPENIDRGKGYIRLISSPVIKGVVQVVKKHGGENNLHYHTSVDTFWMVLKGKVKFYGPGDVLIGEFGPHEGTITPRLSRYWFENSGDEDLELLQVAASYVTGAKSSGRTDVSEQKFKIDTGAMFDAGKSNGG
jgi:mannose-6-phosphate isomerase-like protein (cupin superfamily)